MTAVPDPSVSRQAEPTVPEDQVDGEASCGEEEARPTDRAYAAAAAAGPVLSGSGEGIRRGDGPGHHRPRQRRPLDVLRALRRQGGSAGTGDGSLQRRAEGTATESPARRERLRAVRLQPRALQPR